MLVLLLKFKVASTNLELGAQIQVLGLPIPNSIKFKRNSSREWSNLQQCWIPTSSKEIIEPFTLIRFHSEEFIELVIKNRVKLLISEINSAYNSPRIIFLIESLDKYYRTKQRNINNDFMTAVRSIDDPKVKKKTIPIQDLPDVKVVDEILLWLQIDAGVHLQYSKDGEESADWIGSISKEIAMLPDNQFFKIT